MIKKYQLESEPADSMTLRQIALWAAFPACAALVLAGGIAWNIDRAPEAEPLVEVASAAEAPASAASPVTDSAKTERPAESATFTTAEAPQPLDETDPRWGGDQNASSAGLQAEETAFGAQGDADPLPAGETDELGTALAAAAIDQDTTAAIGAIQSAPGAEVVVAESDQEVAALEQAVASRQDQLPDAAFVAEPSDSVAALDAQAEATSEQRGADADTSDYLPGQTTEYVNFRNGPSNDAETISIVPGGTELQGQPIAECVHFCAVEIDGQQGYIYKAFIEYAAPTGTALAE